VFNDAVDLRSARSGTAIPVVLTFRGRATVLGRVLAADGVTRGAADGPRRGARTMKPILLSLLLSVLVTAKAPETPSKAKLAEDYDDKLGNRGAVVVPLTAAAWQIGVSKTRENLGGKVAAVVLFSPLRDMEAFGRMGNTLAKELGSEKAVFVGSVLDADENTIGDDSLSLPHVLFVLPSGKRIPWSDWVPNMDPTWGHDRLRVAKELGAWIVEQLDACSDSGECHDVISEKKANMVRRNVQEDLRAQAGTRQAYATKKTVSMDGGKLKVDKERHVPASKLDPSKPMGKEKKKKKKKKDEAKDEV
jgi:hypothetical protein